jgi:hypothetical protein
MMRFITCLQLYCLWLQKFTACLHALLPSHVVQRVAQCLQLSDLQALHISIGRDEYQRLGRAATAEGRTLISQAAAPSLALAAAAQQQQQQQQQGTGGCSSMSPYRAGHQHTPDGEGAAAAAAAGAAGTSPNRLQSVLQQKQRSKPPPRAGSVVSSATSGISNSPKAEGAPAAAAAAAAMPEEEASGDSTAADLSQQLDSNLQRHVRSRHLQLRMIAMFYLNTLSKLQIAQMVRVCVDFWRA